MQKKLLQSIITHVLQHASKREILIGIDPGSTLGQDILRQNLEIVRLRREICQLKKMVADLTTTIKKANYSSSKSVS